MKKIKSEKGSITLFVLISMIFFVVVLVGLYINSSNEIQKQEAELQQIQKNYETENIDDLYNSIAITSDNFTSVTTYEELVEKLSNQNESYIVLGNDIETSESLTINRTVTIDLNGYTYLIDGQNDENASITITGTNTELTIKDSSRNEMGSIATTSTNTDKKLISIEDNAKLVLESGAISNDNLSYKDTQIINVSENSEFVMSGGTIIGKIVQKGTMTITEGKIIGEVFAEIPESFSIQGGIVQGKVRLLNGVNLNELSSSAEITGGTVNTYMISEDTTESNGTLSCKVNDIEVTYIDVGDKVYLSATPNTGYVVSGYEVYKEDDMNTIVEILEDNSFTMPDYAVKVKVIYEQQEVQ